MIFSYECTAILHQYQSGVVSEGYILAVVLSMCIHKLIFTVTHVYRLLHMLQLADRRAK